MRKDTLAPAPRRTYVSPAMTLFTLSPRVLQATSPSPVVPVDPSNPGGEALSRKNRLSEEEFDDWE